MLISQQKLTPRLGDLVGGGFRKEEGVIKNFVSHKYLYWVGSGREALRQILLSIGKKRVGMPAYTCEAVLGAVERAGCAVVFYDSGVIAEVSEIEKIIKKIEVLLLCYNFGFLPEIDKIVELCRKNKVILIEDCAQALGASYKDKLAGSFGDYAFYSFGISKNIGFCGGLIGSSKEIKILKLKKFPKLKLLKVIFEAAFSPVFFNKYLYFLTRRFLRKELHKKLEPIDYSLPKLAKKVVLNQFKRYGQILETRKKKGEFCCRELKGLRGINFIEPTKETNPAWLYFTVLAEGREKLIKELLKEKVELGEMKTFKCLDGKGDKALETEKRVLTFALYRDFKEVKFMVDKIKKVASNE